MTDYYEIRRAVVRFLKETNMSAYELARVTKMMCTCGTCHFFVQHYTKDGTPVEFGHCKKNKIPKSTTPSKQSCGFWTCEECNESNVKPEERPKAEMEGEYQVKEPQMYIKYMEGRPAQYRYGEEWQAMALYVDGGYDSPEEAKEAYYRSLKAEE